MLCLIFFFLPFSFALPQFMYFFCSFIFSQLHHPAPFLLFSPPHPNSFSRSPSYYNSFLNSCYGTNLWSINKQIFWNSPKLKNLKNNEEWEKQWFSKRTLGANREYWLHFHRSFIVGWHFLDFERTNFFLPFSLTICKPTKSTKEKYSNDCKRKEENSIINNCNISFEISKRRWDQIKIIWIEWKWWISKKKIHVIRIRTGNKKRTKNYKKMAVTKPSKANPSVGKKLAVNRHMFNQDESTLENRSLFVFFSHSLFEEQKW